MCQNKKLFFDFATRSVTTLDTFQIQVDVKEKLNHFFNLKFNG